MIPVTKAIPITAICLVLLTALCVRAFRQSAHSIQNPARIKAPSQIDDIPRCNGAAAGSTTNPALSQSNQGPHSVTLTWNASVPASASPGDAVTGYYVYRTSSSQPTFSESDRMNVIPIQGTRCIDLTVESKRTYSYSVRAVAGNAQSGYSRPILVSIPSP